MEERLKKVYPKINEVSDEEHIGMVKEIFSTITGRYDFLNHVLSLRRDVAWRRFTVKKMEFYKTGRLLDVACGTLDLSIMAIKRHRDIRAVGVDFVETMLKAGKDKAKKECLNGEITLLQGDALYLPFKDNSFDVSAIAFGIRNIPNRIKALKEMTRVIVPGGLVMVLEMTRVENPLMKRFFHLYLNRILPGIARFFTFNPAAYIYLADSIMNFPSPEEFSLLMEEAGLNDVKRYGLTFGITYLYTGRKKGG
ncbi:MAG: bifunctional demethylmenaquinone methyltransferase/2-methoxy-6-polyprenyl-1,4-benzoquinol methylase UbiE [Syntrophorhabdaceae bacterium]|nr:bifunctional demethylmenaquinone methyltransferase/2-methoxy-6-polyprenyl-1,4-benzoquinol methylase UbiE [Syntrophorhabdaceae bacterium]